MDHAGVSATKGARTPGAPPGRAIGPRKAIGPPYPLPPTTTYFTAAMKLGYLLSTTLAAACVPTIKQGCQKIYWAGLPSPAAVCPD